MRSKQYRTGMYGGKFMPFHRGHLYCIETAAQQCELVYVLLFWGGADEARILREHPAAWLKPADRIRRIQAACARFPNVSFHAVDIRTCRTPDGAEDWDAETPLVRAICGRMDAVYGSEPHYQDYFERAYPEAQYILVDVPRVHYPISGTMLRQMQQEEERELWRI